MKREYSDPIEMGPVGRSLLGAAVLTIISYFNGGFRFGDNVPPIIVQALIIYAKKFIYMMIVVYLIDLANKLMKKKK